MPTNQFCLFISLTQHSARHSFQLLRPARFVTARSPPSIAWFPTTSHKQQWASSPTQHQTLVPPRSRRVKPKLTPACSHATTVRLPFRPCIQSCQAERIKKKDRHRLPQWRYLARQKLLPLVRWETPYLALMQVRSPAAWLAPTPPTDGPRNHVGRRFSTRILRSRRTWVHTRSL